MIAYLLHWSICVARPTEMVPCYETGWSSGEIMAGVPVPHRTLAACYRAGMRMQAVYGDRVVWGCEEKTKWTK